jgi:AraC family transcriptional regulator
LVGFRVEAVQVMRHTPFQCGFRVHCHLLERHDDKIFVEGLSRSALRDFKGALTFIPAGHAFRGSLKPLATTPTTFFYIDPRGFWPIRSCGSTRSSFKPRLFFHDSDCAAGEKQELST